MSDGPQWEAGDVFAVSARADGTVQVEIRYPGGQLGMVMPPEAAQWLAWELITAAQLPWPPPLRIIKRSNAGGVT